MTGWGQDGPLAHAAGHDIGYIARHRRAARHRAGPASRPVPPHEPARRLRRRRHVPRLRACVCALLEAGRTGQGQVVDAAIVDGTAALAQLHPRPAAQGAWPAAPRRQPARHRRPVLRGLRAAPTAGSSPSARSSRSSTPSCCDCPGWTAADAAPDGALDPATWPAAKKRWAELFATRTRDEWTAVFDGTDACVAPVLDWDEAPAYPHLAARGTYVRHDGVVQSAPAPRFDRTAAALDRPPAHPGEHTAEVLTELGRDAGRRRRAARRRRRRLTPGSADLEERSAGRAAGPFLKIGAREREGDRVSVLTAADRERRRDLRPDEGTADRAAARSPRPSTCWPAGPRRTPAGSASPGPPPRPAWSAGWPTGSR